MPFLALLGLVPSRVWVIAGLASALILTGLYAVHTLRQQGADEARQQIEKANAESERKAAEGQAGVDACYASGGAWDRFEHKCVRH